MTRDEFANKVLEIREVLYRVSYSMLPSPQDQDDAVQETIRIALQKRETLRQDVYFKTWLTRILINECLRVLRKRKREVYFPLDALAASLPADGDAEVAEALLALDIKYRLPLVLTYVEGYSNKETAHLLKIPEGTVKWRLSRGRTLLRDQIINTRGEFRCE